MNQLFTGLASSTAICLLSLCSLAALDAANSTTSHYQMQQAADTLSAKDLDVIIQNPEIAFAYMPQVVRETLLKIEKIVREKKQNQAAEELYHYLHNAYKIAPQKSIQKTVKTALILLRKSNSDKTIRKDFKEIITALKHFREETSFTDAVQSDEIVKNVKHYQKELQSDNAVVTAFTDDPFISKGRLDVLNNKLSSDWAKINNLFVHHWIKADDVLIHNYLRTKKLKVQKNAHIGGNAIITGNANIGGNETITGNLNVGGTITGVINGGFTGVIKDNAFTIVDATDATKKLQFDVQGSPSTTTTIVTNPSTNRSFITPDIDGTALVAETGTNEVFIGGPTTTLHGSNSGIQYSTTVANRAQIRFNQYGNNAGIPGVSTFKSRAATIGDLAPVIPGDVIFRDTAVGVTDNLSIPLSGLISINVAPNGVPVGQGWIATDYQIQLVPLTGPANGRKEVFRITSEGIFHIQEAANKMAGIAVLGAAGTVVVPNTQITATSKITLTIQDTGLIGTQPNGFVYVSARSVGSSFTVASKAGATDSGVNVYYQIWEPTTP